MAAEAAAAAVVAEESVVIRLDEACASCQSSSVLHGTSKRRVITAYHARLLQHKPTISWTICL